MDRETTVSLDCVTAWALWTLAITLTLAGTLVLLLAPGSFQARSAGLSLFAFSMLALGGACTLSIRVFLRHQTRYWIKSLRLAREGEAGRPLRQVR